MSRDHNSEIALLAAKFVGEIARPFCLVASGAASAAATVSVVWMRLDMIAGAAFITAAWGGTALLYGAKAFEVASAAKRSAEVEIARTESTK